MSSRLFWILLLCGAGAASAQEPGVGRTRIVVLSEGNGRGVESWVHPRIGGEVLERERTNANGEAFFDACAPQTAFRVRTINPNYSYDDGWRRCRPEIIVTVQPIGTANAPPGVLAERRMTAAEFGGREDLAERANGYQATLVASANAGEWQQMGLFASEIAALYRRAGQNDRAQLYSGLAIESGARAIAGMLGERIDEPLLRADPRLGWVESPRANALLRQFEYQMGLPVRGRWDLPTYRRILEGDRSRILVDRDGRTIGIPPG